MYSELLELAAGDLLITGATGFLGGGLLRSLLRRGVPPERLRCLVRDPGRADAAGVPRVCQHLADLGGGEDSRAEAALRAAACGVGAVVHLAGAVKAWHRAGFDDVNVGGTRRLLAAVAAQSPQAHFVLVSSLAAAGPSRHGEGSADLPDACRPVSAYGESKRHGELAVLAGSLPWTIVRPPVVYGAGDAATRLMFRQACAPLVVVPRHARPLSVIAAEDVVEALCRAIERRPAGAVLPLDGPERTDTSAFVVAMAAACGRRARLLGVPMPLANLAATACDGWALLRRRAGFFSRDKVKEIRACGWVADGNAARTSLGFAPGIDLASGLLAVARAEGFAPPTSATA